MKEGQPIPVKGEQPKKKVEKKVVEEVKIEADVVPEE